MRRFAALLLVLSSGTLLQCAHVTDVKHTPERKQLTISGKTGAPVTTPDSIDVVVESDSLKWNVTGLEADVYEVQIAIPAGGTANCNKVVAGATTCYSSRFYPPDPHQPLPQKVEYVVRFLRPHKTPAVEDPMIIIQY